MSNYDWDDWQVPKAWYDGYIERATAANKESKHKLYDPEEFWAYINQDKIWITADRRELRIKDIEKDHLSNILLWASKHYGELIAVFDLAKKIGKPEADVRFDDLNDFLYSLK